MLFNRKCFADGHHVCEFPRLTSGGGRRGKVPCPCLGGRHKSRRVSQPRWCYGTAVQPGGHVRVGAFRKPRRANKHGARQKQQSGELFQWSSSLQHWRAIDRIILYLSSSLSLSLAPSFPHPCNDAALFSAKVLLDPPPCLVLVGFHSPHIIQSSHHLAIFLDNELESVLDTEALGNPLRSRGWPFRYALGRKFWMQCRQPLGLVFPFLDYPSNFASLQLHSGSKAAAVASPRAAQHGPRLRYTAGDAWISAWSSKGKLVGDSNLPLAAQGRLHDPAGNLGMQGCGTGDAWNLGHSSESTSRTHDRPRNVGTSERERQHFFQKF